MYTAKFRNKYEIQGDTTIIRWQNRKGEEFEILIDTEDLDKIKSLGYSVTLVDCGGYYARTLVYHKQPDGTRKPKVYYIHQFVLGLEDTSIIVDHINHNRLDNRKINLRISKHKENTKNRKGKNSNNTSGYRNVSWNKDSKKWVVQLQVDGKNKILGYFEDIHEAGKFAKEKRKEIYKEYAGAV